MFIDSNRLHCLPSWS